MPARIRNRVLLPVPFGATTPIRLRGPTVTFTRSRTTWGPNDLEMSRATRLARTGEGDTTAPPGAPQESSGRKGSGCAGHYIVGQDSAVDAADRLDFEDDNELVGCQVAGARHAGEAFVHARLVDGEVRRCALAGCDFSGRPLHRVRFPGCRGAGT